ncbi:hypothetical protein HID58_072381, partial [Brassica napus]
IADGWNKGRKFLISTVGAPIGDRKSRRSKNQSSRSSYSFAGGSREFSRSLLLPPPFSTVALLVTAIFLLPVQSISFLYHTTLNQGKQGTSLVDRCPKMSGGERFGVSKLSVPFSPDSSPLSAVDSQKKNRIQVSNTKKPLFFYVNLAKVQSFSKFLYFSCLVRITKKSVEPDGRERSGIKIFKTDWVSAFVHKQTINQAKKLSRAEHSLLLISDAFVFTHPHTQVVSPPLFSSHSHTLSRCRTFSFHLS